MSKCGQVMAGKMLQFFAWTARNLLRLSMASTQAPACLLCVYQSAFLRGHWGEDALMALIVLIFAVIAARFLLSLA